MKGSVCENGTLVGWSSGGGEEWLDGAGKRQEPIRAILCLRKANKGTSSLSASVVP